MRVLVVCPYLRPSQENGGCSFENKKLLFPVRGKKNRVSPPTILRSPSGYNSPVARPHDVLCVARTERSHSHDADSHIRYSSFSARGFCHRRRRHCAGLRCHNSVGLSLRNATGCIRGSRCFRPCIVARAYEILSRCRKTKHPLSMLCNGSSSDSGNFMLPWFKNPWSVQKKSYVRHIRDMKSIRACAWAWKRASVW